MTQTNQARFKGVFPVVPTTFIENGELDLASQKRCVDFMIDAGSNGLCILANFSEQFVLSDDEREVLTRTILEHVAGRVPVIVTTTHFSTQVCAAAQPPRAGAGRGHGDGDAALPRRHLPRRRRQDLRVLRRRVGRHRHPHHDPGRAGQRHRRCRPPFWPAWRAEIEQVAYFKIETAGAATKLRELIRLGGDAIEGPWDGEEAITLLPDLDAGATGAMTGGAYPDGIRRIVDAYCAGRREEAIAALRALAAADQLREPPGRHPDAPRR